jgi:hypothetical protein
MQPANDTAHKPRDYGTGGPADARSIPETARLCGLGRSLVYQYATGLREPRLESFKVGKRRLVTEAARREWLAKLAKG